MVQLFGWLRQQSKTNRLEASDDLSQVETPTRTIEASETELPKDHDDNCKLDNIPLVLPPPSLSDVFIDEHILHIAQYLPVKDLNNFAQVDSYSFKLLFNCEKSRLNESVDYERDDCPQFERVQQLIWKPLVLYYFPKFGKGLNIKNWMHVLRLRVKHIKLHKDTNFQIESPSFSKTVDDEQFIENCEWIYKCPLNFKNLNLKLSTNSKTETRHCGVCNKDVYLVDDMNTFKHHVGKGDCVAYSAAPLSIPQRHVMGAMRPPTRIPIYKTSTTPIPPQSNSRNLNSEK